MIEMTQRVNDVLWGIPAVAVFLFTGIFFSVKLGFFQIKKPFLIFRRTLFNRADNEGGVSAYKAACTALSACIGTGNIVGAAVAVTSGGAGALFWMWIASFLGMATAYAENSLSIVYRKRSGNELVGGAMYTIRDGIAEIGGLGGFAKGASTVYAVFTVLASLGMGGAAQVNTACTALTESFGVSPIIVGLAFAAVYILISAGGMKRAASVSGIVVPFMSLIYCAAVFYILFANLNSIPRVLHDVFRGAFGFNAMSGGFSGAILRNAVTQGIRRGVFSNEAGLGSAAAAHAASSIKNASDAGLWGAFEVYFDTIFMCTLTALAVLCVPGAASTSEAFSVVLGVYAGKILGVCLVLFAFSTVVGWGAYGENAFIFTFGAKTKAFYRVIFAVSLAVGAVGSLEAVLGISDLCNMLLAVPNIISLFLLSKRVPAVCEIREARLSDIPGKQRRRGDRFAGHRRFSAK